MDYKIREAKFKLLLNQFTYNHPTGWVLKTSPADLFFLMENFDNAQKTKTGDTQPGNDTKDNGRMVPPAQTPAGNNV